MLQVTQQAMNYAIRSVNLNDYTDPTLTDMQVRYSHNQHICHSTMHTSSQGSFLIFSSSISQTDNVQTAPRGSQREELLNLQIRLESKIRVGLLS